MLKHLNGSPIGLADLRAAYLAAVTRAESDIRAASAARAELRDKGWTIQAAASAIGRTRQHLSLVLNGKRRSTSILAAVEALPIRLSKGEQRLREALGLSA